VIRRGPPHVHDEEAGLGLADYWLREPGAVPDDGFDPTDVLIMQTGVHTLAHRYPGETYPPFMALMGTATETARPGWLVWTSWPSV
jgi:hypothetical protein